MITALTVSYNTQALLQRAVASLRKFHPDMPLVIVDNSDKRDECRLWLNALEPYDPNLTIMRMKKNIGHGAGMDFALQRIKTPYVLVFDSDIEILDSPVMAMRAMMEEDTYGIGYFEKTGLDGYEYGAHRHHKTQEPMVYLHPYFQLISVKQYKLFHPYVHHGAPCYLAMLDIHKKGLSSKILKEFPGLGHTSGVGWNWKGDPNLKYVRHDTRGTRDVRLKAGQGEIEAGWVLNRGLV